MQSGWKYIVIIIWLLFTISNGTIAQPKMFSFEVVDTLQQLEQRPVMVFIHTDWCRFCAAMKTETFTNNTLVELLNEHFYFIDFDGESTAPVDFNGRTFHYKPTGANTGVHELAVALGTLNGKLSYPVLCILNPQFEIIYQHNSFINANELRTVLEMVMLKD